MIRRAFTMRLKPGAFDKYKHHHDNVWPELVEEIHRSGIASITTFRKDQDLFLVSEINNEKAWDRLWHSDIHRRWAEVMEPLMNLTEDGIVDAGELTEIFHVETSAKRGGTAKKMAARKKSSPAKQKSAAKGKSKKGAAGAARKKTTKASRKKMTKRR